LNVILVSAKGSICDFSGSRAQFSYWQVSTVDKGTSVTGQ